MPISSNFSQPLGNDLNVVCLLGNVPPNFKVRTAMIPVVQALF